MCVVLLHNAVGLLLEDPAAAVNIWGGGRTSVFVRFPSKFLQKLNGLQRTNCHHNHTGAERHTARESVACLPPWGSAASPVPTSRGHASLRADQTQHNDCCKSMHKISHISSVL